MSDVLNAGSFQRARARAADQVAEDLREQILRGQLARGTRLPSEKELAAHYDVSAPTVREALGALSALNLIAVKHGSGTYVTAETDKLLATAMAALVQLERVDIPSIMELTEALYLVAARAAPSAATDDDLTALREATDTLNAASTQESASELLADFLKSLVATSHNPLVIGLSGFLIDTQIALVDDLTHRVPASWHRIADTLAGDRRAIADAFQARDAAAASRAISAYVRRGTGLVRENAGS